MEYTVPILLFLIVILQGWMLYIQSSRSRVLSARDELLEQGKTRTDSLLHKAVQQANKILATAQLKGIKLISQQRLSGSELTRQFQVHLAAIEKALSDQLIRNTEHAEQTYEEFIQGAEKAIKDHVKANEAMLSEKSNAMVAQTEEMLRQFTRDLEEKVKAEIEKKMGEATGEIEQYKLTRIRVIDERIVDVLEEVLAVVLEKKLTLADQSDLVYKALEQAKREHAFSIKGKTSG
jgi:hypothetical protein